MSGTATRGKVVLIYNADGTVIGKLRYAYKKLFVGGRPEGDASSNTSAPPVCGNCDVTHGGLSLSETDAWRRAKADLQASLDVEVVQLHRDELDEATRTFVKQNSVRLPSVLFDDRSNKLREIVPYAQINVCARASPSADVKALQEQRATMLVDAIRASLQDTNTARL